jgi:hypothetical protein
MKYGANPLRGISSRNMINKRDMKATNHHKDQNRLLVGGLEHFLYISMDWFKGKFTGNHRFSH